MRGPLRWLSLSLAACLLAGLMLPAFASETPEPTPEPVVEPAPEPTEPPAPEPTEPPAPEPIRLDPFDPGPEQPTPPAGDIERTEGELHYEIPADWTAQDVIDWFIVQYDLDADCFAASFYCPATGERADWNQDAYFIAASTYKLPLNMYYYEQEAAGVYSPDTIVGGMTLSQAHMSSLLWSMNEISLEMVYYLGPFYVYKHLVTERYGTLPEEEYPLAYWGNNYYSTRFMVDVLTYLYERQEEFPELVGYLKEAMPGYFLKKYNGDTPVLHKYGTIDWNYHDVGILYTEEPCLLAVYTHNYQRNVYGAELIARLGRAMIDYQTMRTEQNRRTPPETEAPETEAPETEPPETEPPETAAETTALPETEVPTTAPTEQTEASAARPGPEVPDAGPAESNALPLLLILAGIAALATGGILLLRRRKTE